MFVFENKGQALVLIPFYSGLVFYCDTFRQTTTDSLNPFLFRVGFLPMTKPNSKKSAGVLIPFYSGLVFYAGIYEHSGSEGPS